MDRSIDASYQARLIGAVETLRIQRDLQRWRFGRLRTPHRQTEEEKFSFELVVPKQTNIVSKQARKQSVVEIESAMRENGGLTTVW